MTGLLKEQSVQEQYSTSSACESAAKRLPCVKLPLIRRSGTFCHGRRRMRGNNEEG